MTIAHPLEMSVGRLPTYKSKPQKARFLTENWTCANVCCPGCAGNLERYPNNSPVADLFCEDCSEDFELKSTSRMLGRTIPDGAYGTMIQRLTSHSNPNLLLLQYDAENWFVRNLTLIPKYYFTRDIIRERAPLSPRARRAGWVGCNIVVGDIPVAGKIKIVSNGVAEPTEQVQTAWKKTNFLKSVVNDDAKGWLIQTMQCIDQIGKPRFELKEVYRFEKRLREAHPNNDHVREKLRQQLQVLRDQGYLRFVHRGVYEIV